jgi:hypothetical protein
MPNWCDNRLAIAGPPKVVQALVCELQGPNGVLDFETLLPTPSDLIVAEPQRILPGDPTEFPDWYAWRHENWGVKWNAAEASRIGYGRTGRVRYRFFTAWGPPAEYLDFVAQRYPEVSMSLTFDVEMMGTGAGSWRGGDLVELYDSPS